MIKKFLALFTTRFPPQEIVTLVHHNHLPKLLEKRKVSHRSRNCYQLNEQGQVVALNLKNNRLEKIEGLEKLIHIEKLYLSGNWLTVIKGLEYLTDLTHLDLSDNQLEQLDDLSMLTKVKTSLLDHNPWKKPVVIGCSLSVFPGAKFNGTYASMDGKLVFEENLPKRNNRGKKPIKIRTV